MSPKELVDHGELEQEWGGYFIIRGIERLIRMLIMTRRNYPIAIKRPLWKTRGEQFSDLGIILRSVQEDNTATVCMQKYFFIDSCHVFYICICKRMCVYKYVNLNLNIVIYIMHFLFTEQCTALCE